MIARVKNTSVTNVSIEKETMLYKKEKVDFVIGVDEVGRGCLGIERKALTKSKCTFFYFPLDFFLLKQAL
jgi:hypothetical protein